MLMLQSEMQQWVQGEQPFTKDTPNLFTEASRYRASVSYTSQSQLSNFVLPSNMQEVLDNYVKPNGEVGRNVSNQDEDCYQAHVLTFRTNPYIYSKNKQRQVSNLLLSPANIALPFYGIGHIASGSHVM